MPDPEPALHVRLDPLGGIAGDMFAAALLDARPELEPELQAALGRSGLPEQVRLRRLEHRSHSLVGSRVEVLVEGGTVPPSGHFASIRHRLRHSDLDPAVAERALRIYGLLAEAEGEVHGVPPDETHFHELADWDSYADIVAAAWLIERLAAASWSLTPLPLGSGRVMTQHGPLPVPAPATALLLRGLPVQDDGIGGERVTPTGAAILRHLAPAPLSRGRVLTVAATGHGFGTRSLGQLPNMLRATLLHEAATATAPAGDETIGVIRFEIDDQTAEDLAIALDRLRRLEGVRDVCQWPVLGKKGRLASAVQLLVAPDAIESLADACLAETATIGLRWRIEQRRVLPREAGEVQGSAVKRVRRPDGSVTSKAEADAIAAAGGYAARRRRRRDVEE